MFVASLIVLSVGVFVASAALISWWLVVTWGAAVRAAPSRRHRRGGFGARVAIPVVCVLALVYTIVFIGLWLGLLVLGVPAVVIVFAIAVAAGLPPVLTAYGVQRTLGGDPDSTVPTMLPTVLLMVLVSPLATMVALYVFPLLAWVLADFIAGGSIWPAAEQ